MATQVTSKLVIVDGMPSVEKLWNGRFSLEFFCQPSDKTEGWYNGNIDKWLPEFGALQDAALENGWGYPQNSDVAYDDMRFIEGEVTYVPAAGEHYVKLVYETLTASYVEEKDEDIDDELNGLKRVTRTFVALPETAYAKVVGTDTITVDGTTLFLGSASIKKTDAKWELTEVWLEAGELSRSDNFEDGKESVSITQIGGCASAPAGYTVANEKKDNTQGFETCTRTFYKDDSELSRSNDYVGSQLAEMIEVFNPTTQPTPTNGAAVLGNKSQSNVDGIPTTRYTFLVPSILSQSEDKVGSQLAITIEAFSEVPATPVGYVLANEQVSDFEGIATRRYSFLKPSILSQSEDRVGSQLAITIEAFNEIPATPLGYTLANTQESDVEGIPTKRYTFLVPSVLSESEDKVGSQLAKTIEAFGQVAATPSGYVLAKTNESDVEGIPTIRYTFLKPAILRLSQELVGGATRVQVSAFDKTEAQVDAAISEVTENHILISQREEDYEGIKTSEFVYEISDFSVRNQTASGLRVIQQTELSINNLTDGVIGATNISDSGSTLYLSSEEIDNGNAIKKRVRKWIQEGLLSSTFSTDNDGLTTHSQTWLRTVGTTPVLPDGAITGRKIGDYEGLQTITIEKKGFPTSGTLTYQTTVPFSIPGIVTTDEVNLGANNVNLMLKVTPPVPATPCDAIVTVTYSTASTVDTSAIYRPTEWASQQTTGFGFGFRRLASYSTYNNHIRVGSGGSKTNQAGIPDGTVECVDGMPVYAGTTAYIILEGPTYDPAGKTITLSISNDPIFKDENDVQYYKKTVVTVDVPARP